MPIFRDSRAGSRVRTRRRPAADLVHRDDGDDDEAIPGTVLVADDDTIIVLDNDTAVDVGEE